MCRLLLAALIAMIAAGMASAETVRVFAAGSLRVALTDVVRTFQAKSTGLQVETEFAASGLLRARIEKGEAAHIFASADMGHPARLFDGGYAKTNVAIFARNQLVRSGARGSQGDAGEPARGDARSGRARRHLHP